MRQGLITITQVVVLLFLHVSWQTHGQNSVQVQIKEAPFGRMIELGSLLHWVVHVKEVANVGGYNEEENMAESFQGQQ